MFFFELLVKVLLLVADRLSRIVLTHDSGECGCYGCPSDNPICINKLGVAYSAERSYHPLVCSI